MPHLNNTRGVIEKVFLKIFQPIPDPLDQAPTKLPFNISVGHAISDYPIIHRALSVLTLPDTELNLTDLHQIWQSPYLQKNLSECNDAASFEQKLAQIPSISLDLQQLIDELAQHSLQENGKANDTNPAAWNNRWQQYLTDITDLSEKKTRSDWFDLLQNKLHQLGWPGYRTLTSHDYQIIQNFYQLLEQDTSADLIDGPITRAQYMENIQDICGQHLFQAQSTSPAPIQILGALEAAGTLYDQLWVSDLHAEQWPAAANPHPFLPPQLQREQQMPHASAEREHQVSSRLLSRLIHSATNIHLSYATQHQDIPQSASTLLSCWVKDPHCPSTTALKITREQPLTALQKTSMRQTYHDRRLIDVDTHQLTGGSALLKDQSLCPFKGFAHWRLRIKPLHQSTYGLHPKQKGMILHAALQYLWQAIGDQKTLLELNYQQLQQVIQQAIKKATAHTSGPPNPSLDFLMQLEQVRLQQLLSNWCDIEKEREPFTIIGLEMAQTITLLQCSLRLRIDRIDCDDQGNYRIIDYKSGATDWQHWFGDRLRDPQLPLYCLNQTMPIASICYASLKAGALKYQGISAQPSSDNQVKTLAERQAHVKSPLPDNWQACLDDWKQKLQQTLTSFIEGQTQCQPLAEDVCKTCSLQTLCRIKHHAL